MALMLGIIIFILSLIRMSLLSAKQVEIQAKATPPPPPPWESFPFLTRYFGGLRDLVPRDQNVPEYPGDPAIKQAAESNGTIQSRSIPTSHPFNPYPDYNSSAYQTEYGTVSECFLDVGDSIRVPRTQAYTGVPRGQPDAVMGSYETLGLDNTVCFDRFGRLGPYGFGYSKRRGGIGAGLEGERAGADDVWKEDPEVDYNLVQWGKAQQRCLDKNSHRFKPIPPPSGESFRDMRVERDELGTISDVVTRDNTTSTKLLPRTAVLIRTMHNEVYTQEDILYLRSLIAELSLLSGGEYTVHFLIHVKDDNIPIWADPDTYTRVLEEMLPKEFHGMGTLWSERQMGLIYGGLEESFYRDLPVHGVYRSTFMPLQYFAYKHPEYDFFWNWEMDTRYTGNWYHFFDKVTKWAKAQPRKGLWERNGRFYVPSIHETWEEFKQRVRIQTEISADSGLRPGPKIAGPDGRVQSTVEESVWGPLRPHDAIPEPGDPEPPTTYEKDKFVWGVDEDADLITFNPLFDPEGTTWLLANDVTGYNTTLGFPPRRTAIITASRLSARLLAVMHRETALQRHTMFSEMWPASCALHHGLKAVYAPHPVFIDRNWPTKYLETIFNGGKNGASGGSRTSVFGDREHNFRGTSWYYNAGFPSNLWRRWLGYRVDNAGGEEEEVAGEGRMCLPGMLLHPVKNVELVIEGVQDD
jgi:hypothetical protein